MYIHLAFLNSWRRVERASMHFGHTQRTILGLGKQESWSMDGRELHSIARILQVLVQPPKKQ